MSEKIDFDAFFYYGENPDLDIQNDLLIGLLQRKRSMFFNRRNSVGLSAYENSPNSISLFINVQYAVTKWIGYRNTYVQSEPVDYRMATSQTAIEFKQSGGEMFLFIPYIAFKDYETVQNITIPMVE